jgi:hypothetical protein
MTVQRLDVGEAVVASHLPQVVVAVRPLQQGRTDLLEGEPDPALPARETAGAAVTQDSGPALGFRTDAGCEPFQASDEPVLEGCRRSSNSPLLAA